MSIPTPHASISLTHADRRKDRGVRPEYEVVRFGKRGECAPTMRTEECVATGKLRIFQMAQEIAMSSTDLLALFRRLGLEAKNQLSPVEPKVADLLRAQLKEAKLASKPERAPAPSPEIGFGDEAAFEFDGALWPAMSMLSTGLDDWPKSSRGRDLLKAVALATHDVQEYVDHWHALARALIEATKIARQRGLPRAV